MMKVNIRNIPHEGLDIERVMSVGELGLEADGFEFDSPLTVQAHLEKADEVLIAKVEVSGRYRFSCSRCLEPFTQDRCEHFTFYLDITPKTQTVELGEDIRQEMIMAIGPIALCRPDCKGICPKCGVNRNETPCECESDPSTHKHLKLDDGT